MPENPTCAVFRLLLVNAPIVHADRNGPRCDKFDSRFGKDNGKKLTMRDSSELRALGTRVAKGTVSARIIRTERRSSLRLRSAVTRIGRVLS
jgi:hypothetical protein